MRRPSRHTRAVTAAREARGSASHATVTMLEIIPAAEPSPSVISIRKKRTENNCGAASNLAITYTNI